MDHMVIFFYGMIVETRAYIRGHHKNANQKIILDHLRPLDSYHPLLNNTFPVNPEVEALVPIARVSSPIALPASHPLVQAC